MIGYCLNAASEATGLPKYIDVPAEMISPEEIYVALRDQDKHFTYKGELHKRA